MPPIRLTPRFLQKVWGATNLRPWFADTREKTGEVWLEKALGDDEPPLPVLIKFLFTTGKLSVQVHPGDAYAAEHHQSPGKTEMWHVLRAEPGAKIAAGFRVPVTREQLEAAALSGEIENLLEWFDARPGDTFYLPAGTVHAVGAGLALLEIQQNSDITFRLYDYGRARELHLQEALTVSSLGRSPARVLPRGDWLVSSPYFTTGLLEIRGPAQYEPARDTHSFVILVAGGGSLDGLPTRAGDAWYFPPGAAPVEIRGAATCLSVFAPTPSLA